MASGGRYYIVEGKRITESEYLRLKRKSAGKATKSTPKSGAKGAATSKSSNSEE